MDVGIVLNKKKKKKVEDSGERRMRHIGHRTRRQHCKRDHQTDGRERGDL